MPPGSQGPTGPTGATGATGPAGADGETGTLILDGTASPTELDGEPDDFYLDTDDHVLYGPKRTEPFDPPETVLTGTPEVYNPYASEMGSRFTTTVNGRVTGVRHYRAVGATDTPVTARLWTSAGALLATGTGTPSAGFNTIMFATPVLVTAGVSYVAGVTIAERYSRSDGTNLMPQVGAHLTLHHSLYGTIGAGIPGTNPGTPNFWIEPIFEPVAADLWPVALEGGVPGPAGPTGATGAAGAAGAAGATGPAGPGSEFNGGFSQAAGSVWLPTGAILENMSRYGRPLTAQAALATGAAKVSSPRPSPRRAHRHRPRVHRRCRRRQHHQLMGGNLHYRPGGPGDQRHVDRGDPGEHTPSLHLRHSLHRQLRHIPHRVRHVPGDHGPDPDGFRLHVGCYRVSRRIGPRRQ